MSADEVMASVLHLAHNMEDDAAPGATAPDATPHPIPAFVAAGRGSHNGRSHPPRDPRGGRGLPNKCCACGSPDHILSSNTAQDDAMVDPREAKDDHPQVRRPWWLSFCTRRPSERRPRR
jgi:hypothetical protein